MEPIVTSKRDLYRIYGATLFFAVHYVLVVYINSNFLSGLLGKSGESLVGLLYVVGSVLTIILLSYAPHILRLIGNKTFMLMAALIEIFALLTLAFSHSVPLLITAFIVHDTIIPVLYFNFDIFIQHFSKHEESGRARGTFLSIVNFCFVIMPLIAGIILARLGFQSVYLFAAIAFIPLLYFIALVRHFKDSEYTQQNILSAFKTTWKNPDVFCIVMSNLVLQMFYCVMVIYTPIYLHTVLGFSLADIGLIFTVMLTPFVIFELPLGKISDNLLGEKEILIAGMIIMGVSTALLPLIGPASLVIWAGMLFLTRVGASWTEIMSESYFFKKIGNEDAELISVWGSLNSISYIIVPLVMSVLLFFIDIKYIFPIIGAVVLSGVFFASRIKDTL